MELRKLLNFKGLNIWITGAAIGLNLFGSVFIWLVAFLILSQNEDSAPTLFQAGILLAYFMVAFLIGWVAGAMAADGRGPTYGVLGSIGAIIPLCLILTSGPTGLFGIILIFSTLMGGLNGGLLSIRRTHHD